MNDNKNTNQQLVLVAGQPNAGKTSIFNGLSGARQNVANYPGVTVEKREGHYKHNGSEYQLVDLPGTYSLSSFSPEERVAQEELLGREPDVVVVVVDSTTLKRSLVFLAQMMHLGVNTVLCLNMSDEARAAGQRLDLELMEQLLGFPVVETIGRRGEGIDRLKAAISNAAANPIEKHRLVLGERLERGLAAIEQSFNGADVPERGRGWIALKLLMDDDEFVTTARGKGESGVQAVEEARLQRARIEGDTNQDISQFVTERYFGFVDGLLKEVLHRAPRMDSRVLSDRIDAVLVNRVLGLPIFFAVMYLCFWLTFTVGEIPMGWIEAGFGWLGGFISSFWAEGSDSALRSLLVDGIIGGVGGVVVFLPNIVLLFVCLAFLEDTGYMARAAFLMDRVMHTFGLHGRSFIPMLTGFGCSIPGIMATRTLENERDRLTTMMVLPLMSCGARLPIWMLIIPAFFAPAWRAPMLWGIYVFGILLALLLALLMRRTVFKGEDSPFVMELPPYRFPTKRAVLFKMAERSWLYVKKAGTLILGISIVMWWLTANPRNETYPLDAEIAAGRVVVVENEAVENEADAPKNAVTTGIKTMTAEEVENYKSGYDLEHSYAGRVGRSIATVMSPLGFDWKISTAMLGAFAAKEVFVAQMGIVYSFGEVDEESETLRGALARDYSPLVAIAMIIFLLIATPCMATFAVVKREAGSWKWATLQFVGLTVIGYLLALVAYQGGTLLGLG